MTILDRPKSLNAIVFAELIQAITSGQIRFGELLSEKTVAATFGTSKTPVREAFFQLQSLGLVEILPQRGCLVFQPTVKAVDDLCELRIVLETAALRFAAKCDRVRLVADLEEAQDEVERLYRSRGRAELNRLDDGFHGVLFERADNASLREAYDTVRPRISTLRVNLQMLDHHLVDVTIGDHRAMIEAVECHDIGSAEVHLSRHIRRMSTFYRDHSEELIGRDGMPGTS